MNYCNAFYDHVFNTHGADNLLGMQNKLAKSEQLDIEQLKFDFAGDASIGDKVYANNVLMRSNALR